MVSRREVSSGDWRFVQTYLRRGAIVPVHAHEGDQWISVLQGALAVTLSGQRVEIHEGELFRVPANTPHEIEALDDSLVQDVRTMP